MTEALQGVRREPYISKQTEFFPTQLIPFEQRSSRQCAAVLRTREEHGATYCCGQPTESGKSWCANHVRIYFMTPKTRK